MNRRSLLSFIGSLPIVGAFVKKADGVALRSTEHPINTSMFSDFPGELRGVETTEISLTPYALAREKVICENGDIICEFMVDVFVGQMQDLPRQLGNWTQEEPQVGNMEIPVCLLCGGLFYRAGGVFHFRDGWRDYRGPGLRLRR